MLNEVRKSIEQFLLDNTDIPICFPNTDCFYDTEFIRVDYLPSEGSQASLGENSLNRWYGIIQITLYTKKGSGNPTYTGDDFIRLFYHYKQNGIETFTGYYTQPIKQDEWYLTIVNIPYKFDYFIDSEVSK